MESQKRFLEKYNMMKWMKALRIVVIVVILLWLFFRFVIGVAPISGDSMMPTFADGDIVVYLRLYHGVDRGDIVKVALPNGENYVKRVVAVAGDVVDIRDGKLFVNDVEETKGDIQTLPEEGHFSYPYTVEDGDVFTLGDNRTESIDSRFYGGTSLKQITGIIKLRFHGLSVEGF